MGLTNATSSLSGKIKAGFWVMLLHGGPHLLSFILMYEYVCMYPRTYVTHWAKAACFCKFCGFNFIVFLLFYNNKGVGSQSFTLYDEWFWSFVLHSWNTSSIYQQQHSKDQMKCSPGYNWAASIWMLMPYSIVEID